MSASSSVSFNSENGSLSPELQHLSDTIDAFTKAELSNSRIEEIRLQIEKSQDRCYIFINDSSGQDSLLIEKKISALTVNENYRTEIDAAIHKIVAARVDRVKKILFERFDDFTKCIEKEAGSSEQLIPIFKLNSWPLAGGGGELLQPVGELEWKGQRYTIRFSDPINCKDARAEEKFRQAIARAGGWSRALTYRNVEAKLKTRGNGVEVSLSSLGSEDAFVEDDRPAAQSKGFLSMIPGMQSIVANIHAAMENLRPAIPDESAADLSPLEYQEDEWVVLSSKVKAPRKSVISKEQPQFIAQKNFEEAMNALADIVKDNKSYDEIPADQLLCLLKYAPCEKYQDQNGSGSRFYCYRVEYLGMFWDIPVMNGNLPVSKEKFLRNLEEIAYLAPALHKMMKKWADAHVYFTTKFQQTAAGRAFMIGLHQLGEVTYFNLSDFDQMEEGSQKVRIPLPEDIYTIKPQEFCQQQLSPVINRLFANRSSQFLELLIKLSDFQRDIASLATISFWMQHSSQLCIIVETSPLKPHLEAFMELSVTRVRLVEMLGQASSVMTEGFFNHVIEYDLWSYKVTVCFHQFTDIFSIGVLERDP